jgi:penicillin-binding protein 1A
MDPFTTSYLSAPFHYQPDSTCNPADPNCAWDVSTFEHTYHGVESVASATVQSDNTVYARLSLDVGPENVVAMARKLGIRTSPLQAVPSLALGSIGVTPLELASAYATLAAGGVYSHPMAITKVVLPNGNADTTAGWGLAHRERVVPDWVASTVTQVLEQNMLYGTGVGAHVANHTDAGKTGTTTSFADAWFSGYTPRLQATVWIGYPAGEIPMTDVHGTAVSGPGFPATIWHRFMSTALGNQPDVPFPKATSTPQWVAWQGQYQYGGASGSSAPLGLTTATQQTTVRRTTAQAVTKPATTASATTATQPPPAAATTTEVQQTTAPPSPVTTEPIPQP